MKNNTNNDKITEKKFSNDEEIQKILGETNMNENNFKEADCNEIEANINNAILHQSCNKIFRISFDYKQPKDLNICKCCLMPLPKEFYIEEYPFCTSINDFSTIGLGLFLYFLFIIFTIISFLVLLWMNSFFIIYLSYESYLSTNPFCTNNKSNSIYTQTCSTLKDDWLYKMSFWNLQVLYTLESKKYVNQPIDHYNLSFTFFLTLCVMLSINYLFLILVRNFTILYRFENISPSNFTLIIRNLRLNFNSTEELLKEITTNKLTPVEINFTYRINDIYSVYENYLEKLNKLKYLNWKRKRVYELNGCCICCEGCDGLFCSCLQGRETFNEIEIEMKDKKNDFKKLIVALKNNIDGNPSEAYTTTAFITFNTEKEAKTFNQLYPKSIFGFVIATFKYVCTNFLCSWFFSERTKKNCNKRATFSVDYADEPEEILWQNLEFSSFNKFLRQILVICVILLILLVSLGFSISINLIQVNQDNIGTSFKKQQVKI